MVAGLDAAAGVAGLISLSLSAFQGCIKLIALISAARRLDQDAQRVSFMLEWEEYRLLQWGEKVGFTGDGLSDQKLSWSLAYEMLKQLHDDLSNAKTLKEKYNLEVDFEVDNEEIVERENELPLSSRTPPITQVGKQFSKSLWLHANEAVRKSRDCILQQQISTIKKLRWAALDQTKLRKLIGDISYFNNCLQSLLETTDQAFMREGMSILLRDLVSRSTEIKDLEVVTALMDPDSLSQELRLKAAIKLKHQRLELGLDRRSDEKTASRSDNPRVARLKFEGLSKIKDIGVNGWETAEYKAPSSKKRLHSQVLIEWKKVPKKYEDKIARRIMALVFLMKELSEENFHVLKCLGFLKRDLAGDHTMYAYVFELSDLLEDTIRQIPQAPRPLSTVLRLSRKPSLTERLAICLSAAETVLQLHTAGWLHKGICSRNVFFIDHGTMTWENGKSLGPYLAGYEYSRHTLEDTEPAPSDLTDDLYRHPLAHQARVSGGTTFRKAFDMYSLGCILLETILWENLEDILFMLGEAASSVSNNKAMDPGIKPNNNKLAHERRLIVLRGKEMLETKAKSEQIFEHVAFNGGDRVRRAVELCFFPSQNRRGAETGTDSSSEEEEISVDTQGQIVRILSSLRGKI